MMERLSARRRRRLHVALSVVTAVLASLPLAGPLKQLTATAQAPTTATVTGTVFNDSNGNGTRDVGEKGIKAVSVSDGVSIVKTDTLGRYRLETIPDRRVTDLVFITQPAGYSVGMDEYSTPRFYRNLGALVVGSEVQADFDLVSDPASKSNTFSFGNIADPHANPANARRTLPYWTAQVEEIASTSRKLAFIQVSGDLTDNATDAEFLNYKGGTAASDVPVWPAVGNHEYLGGATYGARIENYRRHVGPEWYSFDYGKRHFLVLENNGAAPLQEMTDWVARDLQANAMGKEVVVLTHQPMNVPFGGSSAIDQLGDLLEQYRTELILVGHEHSNDADNDPEWVKGAKHVQTNSSSYTIDHSPRGFRYVHMKDDNFVNPFREYGIEKSLTIVTPAAGEQIPRESFELVQVNAYDTSDEVAAVRYRIDGGSWRKLKPSGAFTWFEERESEAPLGAHTVLVEATDIAGVKWSESATFEITNQDELEPEAGADWAQHHGDAGHTGVASDVVSPDDIELAWSYRTGGSLLTGSPVISGGTVYVATRDEDGEGNSAVHAVDMAEGEEIWQYETEISVHGSIAVSGGVVYAQDLRSTIYALDATDGDLLWRRSPADAPAPNNQRTYGYYGVTVADGKVFWSHQDRFGAGGLGSISALDRSTGATLWESAMSGATMSDGTPAYADNKVFVGNHTADRVIAYDTDTGAKLWTSSAGLGGWQDGIPTAAGGRVYIGSNNKLIARDIANNADLWTYDAMGTSNIPGNATPAAPAVTGDTVYMGFPNGKVTALNVLTGVALWTQQLPGTLDFGGVHSSPVVSGNTIYVGSNNGSFYGLNRATGAIVWQREIGAWVGAGPAVSGNTVVVGAWDGNLYAFTER